MKRVLLTLSGLLALALLVRLGAGEGPGLPAVHVSDKDPSALVLPVNAPAAKAEERAEAAPRAGAPASQAFIPAFFPSSKVVATVTDPIDAQGRQRVLETVETNMKERYVRVVRTFSVAGGVRRLREEVSMVANQLLLEKPEGVDAEAFARQLRAAGALDVKAIGEAFLATFTSQPENPHALDSYVSRVKQVAGATVTVEPNYIRKLF